MSKGEGVDCLGLIINAYHALNTGIEILVPEYGAPENPLAHKGNNLSFLEAGFSLVDGGKFKLGDVLVFNLMGQTPFWHLGIFESQQRFLHAHLKRGVEYAPLSAFWRTRLAQIYRLKENG